MVLPNGTDVAATGPIITTQFVQTAADGTVAADCSSGTCECAYGFIDNENGNGCEKMTEEQLAAVELAATTEAPTTTLQPAGSDSVREWIKSMDDKVQYLLRDSRPHLLKKWKKLSVKFAKRYNQVAGKDCWSPDTYQNEYVEDNRGSSCGVSF